MSFFDTRKVFSRLWLPSFMLLMLSSALPLNGEDKPDPPIQAIKDDKGHVVLAGEVEKAFQDMFSVCLGGPLKAVDKKGKNATDISGIPASLKGGVLPLDSYVDPINDTSATNSFGYIYSETQKNNSDFSTPDPGRLLRFEYTNAASYITTTGFKGSSYGKTCGTALADSLQLKGGYSIPVASIQAAFKTDYQKDTTFSIDIGSGQFQSPIDLLKGGLSSDKLEADLLIWDWYERHSDQIGKNNFRISAFTGFAIFEIGSSTSKMTADASVSGGASVAVLTVSANASLAAQYSEGLKLTQFFVGTSLDASKTPQRIVVPFPSITDLEGEVNKASFKTQLDKSLSFSSTLYPGTANVEFREIIQTIPDAFCDSGYGWQTDNPDVALESVKPVTTTDGKFCGFTLIYTPDSVAKAKGITLNPNLVLKIAAQPADHVFTLHTPHLVLGSDDFPQLNQGNSGSMFAATLLPNPAGYNDTQLVWTVRLDMPGNGTDSLTATPPTAPNGLRVSCPIGTSSTSIPVSTNFTVTGANPQTLEMKATALLAGPKLYVTDFRATNRTSCSLVGDVKFFLTNGQTPVKTLPAISLDFPALQDVPKVTNVQPPSVSVGSQVTIAGSDFGWTQGTSAVHVNGITASVQSWSDSAITAVVPAASGPSASLTVVTPVGASASAPLLIKPKVDAIVPPSAPAGTTIVLNGSGFGSVQGTAMLGSKPLVVSAWTDTSIVSSVPTGAATGALIVTTSSGASIPVPFTVN